MCFFVYNVLSSSNVKQGELRAMMQQQRKQQGAIGPSKNDVNFQGGGNVSKKVMKSYRWMEEGETSAITY